MTTVTQDLKDVSETAGKNVKQATEKVSQSLDDAKAQLVSYGNQIQQYLGEIDAKVETYKFSIEKQDEGLSVDIAFRATVCPKK
ncbi:MAG: hypothetical protein ACHQ1H_10960 [Nitrososphaerales archaeon]